MQGFARRLQPRAAVGRADRQADLRIEGRSRSHVPHRQEARLRRPDVQEHQGREQPAGGRGHSARNEPRQLVDRLLRPVAGAPEVAHGATRADFDMLTQRATSGSEQGRLLRPAVAVLGLAGGQASGNAAALQHQPRRHGRRRLLPRPLRRRTRGEAAGRNDREGQPARRRVLFQGLRDQGRLSRIHAWRAQEARLGQGPDRSRNGGDQQGQSDHAGRGVVVDSIFRAASSASP